MAAESSRCSPGEGERQQLWKPINVISIPDDIGSPPKPITTAKRAANGEPQREILSLSGEEDPFMQG